MTGASNLCINILEYSSILLHLFQYYMVDWYKHITDFSKKVNGTVSLYGYNTHMK